MIRVGLLGSTGRMGQNVTHLLATEFPSRARLIASVNRSGSLESLLACDVVIDFSQPQATLELVKLAKKQARDLPAFVIGTTGWKAQDASVVRELTSKTAVLMSSNFSTGVAAFRQILESAALMLRKLGYTPVIVETHHKHKKDAPSGTALMLSRTIEGAGGSAPQTHSIRAGEIVGDHEITFYGAGDHIALAHYAQDRSIFARGAIEAALWVAGKRGTPTSDILTMNDFLAETLLQ